MAGGKETPRQKMIGMMYLVLTALLAMNVSKDILDAFVIINDGIEQTNANFMNKNEFQYSLFEKAKANDPEKVKEFYDKAYRAKSLADQLYEHIETLKKHVVAQTSGKTIETMEHDSLFDLKNVDAKDNYDIPTNIMIGSDPSSPKDGEYTAKELRGLVNNFKEELLFLFDDETERQSLQLGLETKDPGVVNGTFQSWETANFDHVPLAAVVTTLSKIQSDVRNAEADIIKALYRNIDADNFKFDTLAAKVIPRSNYVIAGDSFKADVFVAAFSTTQDPRMRLTFDFDEEGNPIVEDFSKLDSSNITIQNGMATYAVPATSEGVHEWGGVIQIKAPDGSWASYDIPKQAYTVAKPTLVVSPTAMNVFYRGLDNPVEVSVPGVPTEKLEVSFSNVESKSGSNGNFKIKPGKGATTEVTVSAEINGQKQNFGKKEFRVKNVPDPKPYFGGKTGTEVINRGDLLAAQGVVAQMENFEFDLRFQIVSYQVSATVKGKVVEQASNGAYLTADQKTIIGALKSGQKLYIEKIKAKGPDGTIRDLGTIALKLI